MIFRNYLRAPKQKPVLPSRLLQHAGDSTVCGTFVPDDDGPTAIVVGARAPRDAIARLARKHGLETEALEVFARQEHSHA